MAAEQDALARLTPGAQWAAQDLVPKFPSFALVFPKLAKIAPGDIKLADDAMEKWRTDFNVRLTRGANPS